MKDYIELRDQILNINIEQIENYLAINDWTIDGELSNIAKIWHRNEPENQDFEIITPKRTDIKDFEKRYFEVFVILKEFYAESLESIIKKIKKIKSDLLRIRLVAEDVIDGTIPINDGINLFTNAKDILVAASLAAQNKNRYFSNYRPEEIVEYTKKLRLGQTEIGSYIVNVLIPIEPEQIDGRLIEPEESFARKVTKTLDQSLLALKSATKSFQRTSDFEDFLNVVPQGVSSNLCESIVEMSGEQRNRGIRFEIRLDEQENEINAIEFDSEDINIVESASFFLKEEVLLRNQKIQGYVTKLIRDESHDDGRIYVKATVQNKKRNVKIDLPRSLYEVAVQAHEAQLEVNCIGDLHIHPRNTTLIDVKEIVIVADELDQNELF